MAGPRPDRGSSLSLAHPGGDCDEPLEVPDREAHATASSSRSSRSGRSGLSSAARIIARAASTPAPRSCARSAASTSRTATSSSGDQGRLGAVPDPAVGIVVVRRREVLVGAQSLLGGRGGVRRGAGQRVPEPDLPARPPAPDRSPRPGQVDDQLSRRDRPDQDPEVAAARSGEQEHPTGRRPAARRAPPRTRPPRSRAAPPSLDVRARDRAGELEQRQRVAGARSITDAAASAFEVEARAAQHAIASTSSRDGSSTTGWPASPGGAASPRAARTNDTCEATSRLATKPSTASELSSNHCTSSSTTSNGASASAAPAGRGRRAAAAAGRRRRPGRAAGHAGRGEQVDERGERQSPVGHVPGHAEHGPAVAGGRARDVREDGATCRHRGCPAVRRSATPRRAARAAAAARRRGRRARRARPQPTGRAGCSHARHRRGVDAPRSVD